MPAPKTCAVGGCAELLPRGVAYCEAHEALRRAEQGLRRDRSDPGHRSRHRALRRLYGPLVASGGALCARCGEPIAPDEEWDAGEPDGESAGGPEHRGRCNLSGAARLGNRARAERRPRSV